MPEFLSISKAAAKLGVNYRTIWQMGREGKLRHVRVGRAIRLSADDLLALIQPDRAA